jgi:hypothetical protein
MPGKLEVYKVSDFQVVIVMPDGENVFVNVFDRGVDVGRAAADYEHPVWGRAEIPRQVLGEPK